MDLTVESFDRRYPTGRERTMQSAATLTTLPDGRVVELVVTTSDYPHAKMYAATVRRQTRHVEDGVATEQWAHGDTVSVLVEPRARYSMRHLANVHANAVKAVARSMTIPDSEVAALAGQRQQRAV